MMRAGTSWLVAVVFLLGCGGGSGGSASGDSGPSWGAGGPGGDGDGAAGGPDIQPGADTGGGDVGPGADTGGGDVGPGADTGGDGGGEPAGSCGDGLCGPGEEQCTCPTDCGACPGCCQGAVCRKGGTDDACGIAGEACGACDPGARCDFGVCACAPSCDGAGCGDDGCGGSCGDCPAGEWCDDGACSDEACTPSCDGATCGDDGCGGSCGACGPGEACEGGACAPAACVPACAGECGDDGCGGSCGACPAGETCQSGACSAGPCAPSCAGKACGDDGCGGSCGVCGPGHACSGGACVCQPSCAGKACGDDGCGGSCGGCDDGDGCNGEESCEGGVCTGAAPPSCPVAPPECAAGSGPGPKAGVLTATGASGFRMTDEGGWATAAATLDAIAAHPTVTPVTLTDVLNDLNRTATKVSSVPGVECFHAGFTWESGDVNVDYWWPQGVSGTATAYPGGAYNGRKVAIVAWYHKPELDSAGSPDKGVRVAIVDTTDLSDLRYRLALLVAPTTIGGTPTYGAVKVHAGGIAWYRDYLYVADTSNGLRVFDMTRILRVQTGDKDAIGKVNESAGYHAAGYRYVIPQVTRYKLCGGTCCARFSFVAVDPSTTPPSLLAGEYTATELSGRLHRWPLNTTTGRMLETAGVVQATEALFPGVAKMQGAHSHDGKYFVATSKGSSNGTLHVGTVGSTLKKRSWVVGPEDLHWSPYSDNLWTASEYPGKRWVYAVKSASVWSGCP